jgi:hypothetical protein
VSLKGKEDVSFEEKKNEENMKRVEDFSKR